MLELEVIKRTSPDIIANMQVHYSRPKGFVGRNICYRIWFDGEIYGHIVGGSATRFLPGRDEFLGLSRWKTGGMNCSLNNVVNNIFYHISPKGRYPVRNFTSKVLREWEQKITKDWLNKYGDSVLGFESLVELPRTGELYKRAGYVLLGQTEGFTCKRISGISTDSWSGKRIWDTENLRPKLVFGKLNNSLN